MGRSSKKSGGFAGVLDGVSDDVVETTPDLDLAVGTAVADEPSDEVIAEETNGEAEEGEEVTGLAPKAGSEAAELLKQPKKGLESYYLDPSIVLRLDEENQRTHPHTREDVDGLIKQIISVGQTVPGDVVPTTAEERAKYGSQYQYKVVNGYGRHTAVCAIITEGIKGGTDKERMFLAHIRDWNPRQQMIANVANNSTTGRKYTVVDMAVGYRNMQQKLGMKPGEIAKAVGQHSSWVTEAMKLLVLPPEYHQLITAGKVAARAAIDLAKMSKTAQDKVLAEFLGGDREKFTKSDSEQLAREERAAGREAPRHTLKPSKQQEVFESYLTEDTLEKEPWLCVWAGASLKWLRGELVEGYDQIMAAFSAATMAADGSPEKSPSKKLMTMARAEVKAHKAEAESRRGKKKGTGKK